MVIATFLIKISCAFFHKTLCIISYLSIIYSIIVSIATMKPCIMCRGVVTTTTYVSRIARIPKAKQNIALEEKKCKSLAHEHLPRFSLPVAFSFQL